MRVLPEGTGGRGFGTDGCDEEELPILTRERESVCCFDGYPATQRATVSEKRNPHTRDGMRKLRFLNDQSVRIKIQLKTLNSNDCVRLRKKGYRYFTKKR
jgi:hypothetical protein